MGLPRFDVSARDPCPPGSIQLSTGQCVNYSGSGGVGYCGSLCSGDPGCMDWCLDGLDGGDGSGEREFCRPSCSRACQWLSDPGDVPHPGYWRFCLTPTCNIVPHRCWPPTPASGIGAVSGFTNPTK
jgi:hypothetical protein